MLDRVVRAAAVRFGERTCLVAPGGWSLSYAELDRISDEVAVGMLERGVTVGSVVALALPTSPDHVVAFVAAAKIGAITAGINPRLTDTERDAVLTSLGPKHVLEHAAAGDGPESILWPFRGAFGGPPPLEPDPDRPIAIVLTSGTTGLPKGAVFCGRQIEFITQVDTGGAWGEPAAPPLHGIGATSLAHLGPTTKLAGNLMRGGTTHLLDRWTAAEALRLTEAYAMPTLAGIPTQLALMHRHPNAATTDLSSVRAVIMGGGPATPELVRSVRSWLGAPVAIRYACTEAGVGLGTTFTDPPEDAEVSVGRAHDGVEISIRAADANSAVPDGEIGEVCLRSPAVMSEYWRDPASTAAAFTPDGFVRTGDLGRLDDQGRLGLVGRSKDMYVRGGYNVYPMEVETVLADDPSIAEVAVIAVPDPVMGEIGVAFVVPNDPRFPPTLDEIRAYAGHRLSRYKLPERLIITPALPLTPMHKVDKASLRALAAGEQG